MILGSFVKKYKTSAAIAIALIIFLCFFLSAPDTTHGRLQSPAEGRSFILARSISLATAGNVEEISSRKFHSSVLARIAPKLRTRYILLEIPQSLRLGMLVILLAFGLVCSSSVDRHAIISCVHKKDGKK